MYWGTAGGCETHAVLGTACPVHALQPPKTVSCGHVSAAGAAGGSRAAVRLGSSQIPCTEAAMLQIGQASDAAAPGCGRGWVWLPWPRSQASCCNHPQPVFVRAAMDQLALPKIDRISGEVQLPGSKSLSNRTLLLAALASGSTSVVNILVRPPGTAGTRPCSNLLRPQLASLGCVRATAAASQRAVLLCWCVATRAHATRALQAVPLPLRSHERHWWLLLLRRRGLWPAPAAMGVLSPTAEEPAADARSGCAQDSEDVRYMVAALQQLGVAVAEDWNAHQLRVTGCAGRFPAHGGELFLGNAGTAMRCAQVVSRM